MSNYLCRPSNSIENLLETTASASDILKGKTAFNSKGSLLTGSMVNNGRWSNADKVTFEESKIWMYKSSGYTEGGLGRRRQYFW